MIEVYRKWAESRDILSARVEQYCGVEHVGSLDVPLDEIEDQIVGCLAEGFRVEWNEENKHLTICVIEGWDEPLDWNKVKGKEHFSDIDEILRKAGF